MGKFIEAAEASAAEAEKQHEVATLTKSTASDDSNGSSSPRTRLESTCSNDSEFNNMTPLDFDDMKSFESFDSFKTEEEVGINFSCSKLFSVAMMLKRQNSGGGEQKSSEGLSRCRKNWKIALKIAREQGDPWAKFHLDELPTENAIRHRYNALSKEWKTEKCLVKMDDHSFAKGAMRECFRMKKLSNFSHNQDWAKDTNNYVAKGYMTEVARDTYFEDVKLQMDAKLWGEEYNRHNPPKPVDIFQMAVLEFPEREGRPLFHVEHFIDGEYIKYNSNSGFVDNKICRKTPHAFSHFTFERSGHEMIVVDIQGVGDLYTDPQIHTADGLGYGDGNLGTKGMALFFHSHACNDICKGLGLTPFDRTKDEIDDTDSQTSASSSAKYSDTMIKHPVFACEAEVMHQSNIFYGRQRSNSAMAEEIAAHAKLLPPRRRTYSDYSSMEDAASPPIIEEAIPEDDDMDSVSNHGSLRRSASQKLAQPRRRRMTTECSDDSGVEHEFRMSFQECIQNNSRPSNISSMTSEAECEILGNVHMDLAKYHEICRFTEDGTYDKNAAFFHLKCAADCYNMTAIITLAQMFYEIPHDLLSEVEPPSDIDCKKEGWNYMAKGAEHGDRSCMVFLARAYDQGLNLPHGETKSAKKAFEWYEKIVEYDENEGDETEWGMDDPPYILMARQAELLLADNPDLAKDPSRAGDLYNAAAESAMACMKGKLANKYYMFAEEAYGQVEEEE